MPGILFVVEDRHAERRLREVLRRSAQDTATVLTADALLAMKLRRERIDARLVTADLKGPRIDALDAIALSALDAALSDDLTRSSREGFSSGLGSHLQYSLIPTFIRSVRNVAVLHTLLSVSTFERIVVVGGGALARAARLVAADRRLRLEVAGASRWELLTQAIDRLRAGRHTRWVGTEFRALVLEPGFLLLQYAKGWWLRCTRRRPATISRDALIVTGDRWTADVVSRVDPRRTVIVAGATQPGRAMFRDRDGARVVPIERWSEPADLVRGLAAIGAAAAQLLEGVANPTRPERFDTAGSSIWPLVGRVLHFHVIVWIPLLRYVQTLVKRVAETSPEAVLLTSADATGYAGALIAGARQVGISSTSIQHGLMGEPNGHQVVRADILASWGAATEQWHRARAPQMARFVVTGNPRFDRFPTRTADRASDSSRPFTVVVCTGFVSEFSVCASDALNLDVIQATLDWAAAQPAIRIVHKLHPGEEPGYYAAAAAQLGWNHAAFTTTNEPVLHDLLQTADVLVTGYSTTVIESILLGTRVVVCDFEQRRLLPIDRVPGVSIATSVGQLREQLDAVSRGEGLPLDPSHPELTSYISTLDGRAAERIATLVTRQTATEEQH